MCKRLGLPKNIIYKEATKALENGTPIGDLKGMLRSYVDRKVSSGGIDGNRADHVVVYNQHLYFFGGENRLITCYKIPQHLHKYMNL